MTSPQRRGEVRIAWKGSGALEDRIPRRRNAAVARAVLLDMGEPREGIMEALHQELVGDQHVVDLAAGFFGLIAVLVEESVPLRIGRKQPRVVGGARLAYNF